MNIKKKCLIIGSCLVTGVVLTGILVNEKHGGDKYLDKISSKNIEDVNKGEFLTSNGVTKYKTYKGKYLRGWHSILGSIYHFDDEGVMSKGIKNIDGVKYTFLEETGQLVSQDNFVWVMGKESKPKKIELLEEDKNNSYVINEGKSKLDVLPKNIKKAEYSESVSYSEGDWWENKTKEEIKDKITKSLVWRNVITGDIYQGVEDIEFGFNQEDAMYGGLELLSNPYDVILSTDFTGTRFNMVSNNEFSIDWNIPNKKESISLGKIKIRIPKAKTRFMIDDLYY